MSNLCIYIAGEKRQRGFRSFQSWIRNEPREKASSRTVPATLSMKLWKQKHSSFSAVAQELLCFPMKTFNKPRACDNGVLVGYEDGNYDDTSKKNRLNSL